MRSNFLRHYQSNKAPFGVYLQANAWFQAASYNFAAYLQFLDYIGTLDDVYIVSMGKVFFSALKKFNSFNACERIGKKLITNWSTGCGLDEEPRTFVTNALFPGLSVSLHASVYVQPTKLLLRCINHSRQ